jgi:DNA transformation protein
MFALEFDGAIFLKVDQASIPDFEREGSRPFVYTRAKSPGKIGRASLSYWLLPERLYDDPEELAVWAKRALAIAERKKTPPRARARAKPLRNAPQRSKRHTQRRS